LLRDVVREQITQPRIEGIALEDLKHGVKVNLG
jgi:hypothetical protein